MWVCYAPKKSNLTNCFLLDYYRIKPQIFGALLFLYTLLLKEQKRVVKYCE